MELMKGDSLEVSDVTPMYNPQGVPLINTSEFDKKKIVYSEMRLGQKM